MTCRHTCRAGFNAGKTPWAHSKRCGREDLPSYSFRADGMNNQGASILHTRRVRPSAVSTRWKFEQRGRTECLSGLADCALHSRRPHHNHRHQFCHRCRRLRQRSARALASEWGADHRGVTPIASSGRADYQRSASCAVAEELTVFAIYAVWPIARRPEWRHSESPRSEPGRQASNWRAHAFPPRPCSRILRRRVFPPSWQGVTWVFKSAERHVVSRANAHSAGERGG